MILLHKNRGPNLHKNYPDVNPFENTFVHGCLCQVDNLLHPCHVKSEICTGCQRDQAFDFIADVKEV